MKKISMFSVFAIFGAILLFSFAGCANTDDFTQKEYSSEGNAIERIVIDVTDRELDIRASEDDRVHIYYYDSEKEFLDIDVSDNALTVKLTFDKEWTDFIGVKPSAEYRKIEISIPNGTVVDLSAKTTNEDIKVTSLSFSDSVSLDSNGGNIVCERINAGKSIALTAKKRKHHRYRFRQHGRFLRIVQDKERRLQSARVQGRRSEIVFRRLQQRRYRYKIRGLSAQNAHGATRANNPRPDFRNTGAVYLRSPFVLSCYGSFSVEIPPQRLIFSTYP